MHLVFLDESGSPYLDFKAFADGYEAQLTRARRRGRGFPVYPFYITAAVGIPESKYSTIDDWFRYMKSSYFKIDPRTIGTEYEIKGNLLYSLRLGKEPLTWKKARPKTLPARQKAVWGSLSPRTLQNLEESVFSLFDRIKPIIWIIVAKQAHLYRRHKTRTWPPHHWCLTYLQQRVAQHVEATHGCYERGLLIMDETSNMSKARHFDRYLTIRAEINSTASWPVDFGRHLIDIPVTAQSHLIQGLQLPDVVAHAAYRLVRKDDTLGWFERIKPFLATHWRTQRHERAGLTFLQ